MRVSTRRFWADRRCLSFYARVVEYGPIHRADAVFAPFARVGLQMIVHGID
jgi:hypothetical protein